MKLVDLSVGMEVYVADGYKWNGECEDPEKCHFAVVDMTRYRKLTSYGRRYCQDNAGKFIRVRNLRTNDCDFVTLSQIRGPYEQTAAGRRAIFAETARKRQEESNRDAAMYEAAGSIKYIFAEHGFAGISSFPDARDGTVTVKLETLLKMGYMLGVDVRSIADKLRDECGIEVTW